MKAFIDYGFISRFNGSQNLTLQDALFKSEWKSCDKAMSFQPDAYMAWDLIRQLNGSNKKYLSETIIAPVTINSIDKDTRRNTKRGALIEIRIDALDNYTDELSLFRDPRYMLFQKVAKDMLDKFNTAVQIVTAKYFEGNMSVALRWKLEFIEADHDKSESLMIEGPSASGAFALCTLKLLQKIKNSKETKVVI
jgi:hypothetical protein